MAKANNSGKARAKKLDTSVPMKGVSVNLRPNVSVPLPPVAKSKSGPAKASKKDDALDKIRQKFGEDEYQRAVKLQQQTFRGQQRTNSELRNKGA